MNHFLRDQDVILVPNYENRIFINGEFKNKGIFEVKDGEKLNDLIKFTGGIVHLVLKKNYLLKELMD